MIASGLDRNFGRLATRFELALHLGVLCQSGDIACIRPDCLPSMARLPSWLPNTLIKAQIHAYMAAGQWLTALWCLCLIDRHMEPSICHQRCRSTALMVLNYHIEHSHFCGNKAVREAYCYQLTADDSISCHYFVGVATLIGRRNTHGQQIHFVSPILAT